MEDSSFKVRVERAFGGLSSSPSSSSSSSWEQKRMWCLSDEELHTSNPQTPPPPRWEQRIEEKLHLRPFPPPPPPPHDYEQQEEESLIQSSIGFDSSLDFEEEEDECDKVAVDNIKPQHRLYMKDVRDYGMYIESANEIPSSFRDVAKDPRADLIAANLRLKEDSEAAKKMGSLHATEKGPSVDSMLKSDKLHLKPENNHSDSNSQKRVRFDPVCRDCLDESSGGVSKNTLMEIDSTEATVYPLPPDYPSGIPDYMRNPSKYTRYAFDASTDVDEDSNLRAYLDFLNTLKRSNGNEPVAIHTDLPKSPTFIPKRKTGGSVIDRGSRKLKQDVDNAFNGPTLRRGLVVGTAIGEDNDDACAMEDDEPEVETNRRKELKKSGRQYRTETALEMDDESC